MPRAERERWRLLLARLEQDVLLKRRDPLHTPDRVLWNQAVRWVRRYSVQLLSASGLFDPGGVELDDVVQEVMLRLQSFDVLQRLQTVRNTDAYLAIFIRNTAISLARRSQREARKADAYSRAVELEAGDADVDPDVVLSAGIIYASLDADDRLLLRLRFWEDLGLDAIAEQLGVSYGTAAVRLSRLLARLRTQLTP
jgi:RNA polymerase sigma factor (sigma-70 family)